MSRRRIAAASSSMPTVKLLQQQPIAAAAQVGCNHHLRLQVVAASSSSSSSSPSNLLTLFQTKQLHALFIFSSSSSCFNPCVATVNLLRSYAANGDLPSARLLFDRTPHRPVLLWNAIIRAHARHRHFALASSLFNQMRRCTEAKPDGHTFACVLRACAENSDIHGVKMVHALVFASGFLGSNMVVDSAVVSSYSKLGLVEAAGSVFDRSCRLDLVLWNSMISGYGYGGLWLEGLALFRRMRGEADVKPDGHTLVAMISAFWGSGGLPFAQGIHGFCLKGGHSNGQHVRSALVSMYTRCGCVLSGYRAFSDVSRPDLVTWSAVISGFSQVGKYMEAILLFSEMIRFGKCPDSVLIASVLSTCASFTASRLGREIHGYALRHGMDSDIAVSSALIDMYAKCGFAEQGVRLLQLIPERNSVTFNALILGLGSHGLFSKAVSIFEGMLAQGLRPDAATFSALLCACCHSGLLDEGWKLFRRMRDEFGLEAKAQHYVYMVKLLAMAGQLQEAYDLIQTMHCSPDSGVWGALLWGCGLYADLEMGKLVAQKLFETYPSKMGYKVMLSNIYAIENRWDDVRNLRDQMMVVGLQKSPGISWICNHHV